MTGPLARAGEAPVEGERVVNHKDTKARKTHGESAGQGRQSGATSTRFAGPLRVVVVWVSRLIDRPWTRTGEAPVEGERVVNHKDTEARKTHGESAGEGRQSGA